METYSTQVIELLSLGRLQDDRFQIKIAVTFQDQRTSHALEIDEFTYLHLDALQPLNGGRVRLSPYPKWDPYRNTYYGALIRMNGVSRETLYFACSEAFKTQLQRVRERESLSAPPHDEVATGRPAAIASEGAGPHPAEQASIPSGPHHARRTPAPHRSRRVRRTSAPTGWKTIRYLVAGGLLVYLCIWYAGYRLTDDADILSGHAGTAKAATTVAAGTADLPIGDLSTAADQEGAVVQVAKYEKDTAAQAEAEPVQTAPAQNAASSSSAAVHGNYEVFEIDGDQSFYGLPKAYVALTFDDGPSAYTKKIVDILIEQKVAATFLFIGQNVSRHSDAVTYASEQGMSIGNHSWDHSVMTKADREEQRKNLAKTSEILESLTHTPVTLFRPPYGAIDDVLIASAKEERLKVLLWNRDPEDWHAKKPEDILKYFHEVKAPGGVYVLHEDKKTVEALPDIIAYLKKNKLKFATFK
ncbi:polysaccharide deacetylase family protein [Cohnella nanjingensis]|uniref:Polysaccharide deacetylase family protein n=1 Tax=Cohnella nanjingensis TaxID=1387779 RepID=A0A7X0VGS9_9BACL|nr:polysaccharide deacetylase family protein [Cohnella nanjingensis]MBB6671934.1 polysaccharide deacetylase family protein [Cohnella nanjingensis]